MDQEPTRSAFGDSSCLRVFPLAMSASSMMKKEPTKVPIVSGPIQGMYRADLPAGSAGTLRQAGREEDVLVKCPEERDMMVRLWGGSCLQKGRSLGGRGCALAKRGGW